MMKQILAAAVIAGGLSFPLATGCDRKVSEEKTVKVDRDGDVHKKVDTVTREADGDVVHTEKKVTERAPD